MKRLLLLLAAIALPTDVNANWFSRDIVIKSDIGAKFIIKEATVSIEEEYYKSDYIKMGKEFQQKRHNKRIKNMKYPETLEDVQRQTNIISKSWFDGVRGGKHAVRISYRVIYEDLNGYKEADYDRSSAFCINPKLRNDRRANWKNIQGYSYKYMKKTSNIRYYWIKKAICDKYAKF